MLCAYSKCLRQPFRGHRRAEVESIRVLRSAEPAPVARLGQGSYPEQTSLFVALTAALRMAVKRKRIPAVYYIGYHLQCCCFLSFNFFEFPCFRFNFNLSKIILLSGSCTFALGARLICRAFHLDHLERRCASLRTILAFQRGC